MKRLKLTFAAGLLLNLFSHAGFSQLLDVHGLSAEDLDRMHAAAASLYEGHPVGSIERWHNPDTRNGGEVKLARVFDANGTPCRTFDYSIAFGAEINKHESLTLTWCKISDVGWKIVEPPDASE